MIVVCKWCVLMLANSYYHERLKNCFEILKCIGKQAPKHAHFTHISPVFYLESFFCKYINDSNWYIGTESQSKQPWCFLRNPKLSKMLGKSLANIHHIQYHKIRNTKIIQDDTGPTRTNLSRIFLSLLKYVEEKPNWQCFNCKEKQSIEFLKALEILTQKNIILKFWES